MSVEETSTVTRTWPRSAAILGSGTMGLGVAESFAAAGLQVRLSDATAELANQGRQRLLDRVDGHVRAGLLPAEVLDRAATVEVASELVVAVHDVDLVFEAVPERIEVKRDVLATADAHARPDAVIVSNTSSLPIDELATFLQRPERFLGMHWFNPPEWTPGVEVIPAAVTDPDVVERVMRFLQSIGKRPAIVGSGPGFVANRIQFALFREALACVEAGLASPEEVDEVVRSCFGFRLPFFGPFQIADMAGLDVYANIFEIFERSLGEAWQTPAMVRALVEQGRIGTKSGAGFFYYSPEARERLLLERDRRYAELNKLLAQLPPLTSRTEQNEP
jgi:3-hydroxybutyryl-CoA dehydrogenase